MEARGEIRGGRFVAGYVGEQFALPEALDALRAARRGGEAGDVVDVGAYDPLQLAAGMLPAPRPLSAIAIATAASRRPPGIGRPAV